MLSANTRGRSGFIIAALVAGEAAWAGDNAASAVVRLKYAQFDPRVSVPVVEPWLEAFDQADPGVYLVQFSGPPTEAARDRVRALGGVIGPFMTDHTHLVRMDAGTATRTAALPEVRWVGPYKLAYRLSTQARMDVIAAPVDSGTRYSIHLFDRGPGLQGVVASKIAVAKGIVDVAGTPGFRMDATLTPEQLRLVAGLPEVVWVEPFGPPGADMTLARTVSGATPYLSGLGITGQGVRGQIADDGIRASHTAFAAHPPIFYGPAPAVEFHGTATYGISFCSGAGNAGATGVLSSGQGIFLRYSQLTDFGGSVTRYSAVSDLVNPSLSWQGVFQLSAWGGNLTTEYATASAEIDDIVFLHDIIVSQSQSNQGSQNSRPQAWGKNVVSVTGVDLRGSASLTDDQTDDASFGPAEDGRIKPELTHSYNDATIACEGNDSCFGAFGGTSASSAIVAGMFGLVHQMWHEGVWTGFGGGSSVFASRPKTSTARALVISGTHQYDWTLGGPNASLTRAKQGWGLPNLQNIHAVAPRTFIVNGTDPVTQGQTRTYQVSVASGEPYLRTVMVYTDLAGNPAAAHARINDLTLRVTAPGGATQYWGNVGLNSGVWSSTGGAADTVNTVECVFVQNPAAGIWTIEVIGSEVVADAYPTTGGVDATFSLVAAGASPTVPFVDVPNLTQTITVPEGGGVVLIATDGGVVSSSTTISAFVDVRLNIDNVPMVGGLRRICVEGTSSTDEPHAAWSMTRVVSLPAGSHTIKVQAAKVSSVDSTGSIVSGPTGSAYQGSLSVSLIKQ